MADVVVMSAEEFKKSITAQGGKILSGFTGGNREIPSRLEVGDVFTMPTDLNDKVIEQPIAGSNRTYQYLRVEVISASGDKSFKNIGAGVFNRRLPLVDANGNPTGQQMSCSGTAHDEFMKHGSLNDAFMSLAGKTLVVVSIPVGQTRSFRAGEPFTTSYFPQIDIKKQLTTYPL